MIGEIVVKILTPNAPTTATTAPAAGKVTSTATSSTQTASTQTNGNAANAATAASPAPLTSPSTSNAYDKLISSDIGTDDGTYSQVPAPAISQTETALAVEAVTSSNPSVTPVTSPVSHVAAAAIEAVATDPAQLLEATEQVSDVTPSPAHRPATQAASGTVGWTTVPTASTIIASIGGQAAAEAPVKASVADKSSTVAPVRAPVTQAASVLAKHVASTHTSVPTTTSKVSAQSDDLAEAHLKSIEDQHKLSTLKGLFGSGTRDGLGALFLLGQQTNQASSSADLVSILYGQN